MRSLVLAGARQKPRQQYGRDQPRESRHFQRARGATRCKIEREYRERYQAAEQSRRHESAMTRTCQGILARRGMQQRIQTIANDTYHCPDSRAAACLSIRTRRNAPLSAAPCQSEIK